MTKTTNGYVLTLSLGLPVWAALSSSSDLTAPVTISSTQTSGSIINLAYSSATTITGATYGIYIDLYTNVTNHSNLVGSFIRIGNVTNSSNSSYSFYGNYILVGSLANTSTGQNIFYGSYIVMPSAGTTSSGTFTSYGLYVNMTAQGLVSGGTLSQYGLYVVMNGGWTIAGITSGMRLSDAFATVYLDLYSIDSSNNVSGIIIYGVNLGIDMSNLGITIPKFSFIANATDPTAGGGAATGRIAIDIGGSTKYLAYY